MNDIESDAVRCARQMKALTENRDFEELILKRFIRNDLMQITLVQDVTNERIQHELIARKILSDYINDIIATGEKLIEQYSERNE